MRALRRATLCLLPNELEEMEASDDNLFEEDASFLSVIRPLGAIMELMEDMAVKVDAIYSFKPAIIDKVSSAKVCW